MAATISDFNAVKIRQSFPLLQREMNGKPLIFLDSAASSQKPDVVIQALEKYYHYSHANVHRGVYQLSQEATDKFEAARETIARFINAPSAAEIIFTKGTTESINLVAFSFGERFVHAGDEVVITEMEHHANIVPWQVLCERKGATLKVVPINERGELRLEELEKMLSPKVRILALTHVSNTLGTVNPVAEIIDLAHQKGVPVLVDGAQSVPHLPIDVQALDADFFVFSGHKMYGPTGIGVLFGKEKWLNEMPPYQTGGEMIDRVTFEKTTWNTLPFKFEAGTPNIADTIVLATAADYIQQLGREKIAQHEAQLMAYATEQLSQIPELTIIGTAAKKSGSLSFVIEGAHPYDVGVLLDKQGIAVRTGHHCTQPLMDIFGIPGTVRVSFGVYTTKADIDVLLHALKRSLQILL